MEFDFLKERANDVYLATVLSGSKCYLPSKFYQIDDSDLYMAIAQGFVYKVTNSFSRESVKEIHFLKKLSYKKTKLNTKQCRVKHIGVLEKISFDDVLNSSLSDQIKTQLLFNINLFI